MPEKTTQKVAVEITARDGHVEKVSGDTAIVFTVENAAEYLNGKTELVEARAICVGKNIPEPVFAPIIGSLVGSFIKQSFENETIPAAYNMHRVSEILEAYSQKETGGASAEEIENALKETIEELLKAIFD